MFSIKDRDVSLADIQSSAILYMAVKDLMFYPSGNPPRLPVAYQEVEYIETTGTQCINTGLYPSNNMQVETKVEVNSTETDAVIIFGSVLTSSGDGSSLGSWYHLTAHNLKFYYGLNSGEGNAGTYSNVAGTQYKIVFNDANKQILINDSSIATIGTTQGYSGTTLNICRRGTSSSYRYGRYKYFYFKMYDKSTNKYVRDYIPCFRKEDGVAGLYDLVTNEFYTNAGSGSFIKGPNVEYTLPNGYQELYYTQSSGTQYIDTGFITTPNTKARVDFQFTSLVQSACNFGNTGSGTSTVGATFNRYLGDSAGKFKFGIANGTGQTDVWNNPVMNSDTNRHTFECKNGRASIFTSGSASVGVNTVKSISQNCNHSSLLFAAWDPDTNAPSGQCSGKLYGCTIFESEVMVRNFTPCQRKSDGTVGLYDFVTKQFFENAGTGTFTAGPRKMYDSNKNTIAYYPLEMDTNDYSGNKKNLTNNGITFTQQQGFKCGYNNQSTSKYARGSFALTSGNNPFTISCFAKNMGRTSYGVFIAWGYGSGTQGVNMYAKDNNFASGGWTNDNISSTSNVGKWTHLVYTFDGSTGKLYANNVLIAQKNNMSYSVPTSSIYTTMFASYIGNQSSATDALNGYISQMIVENYAWNTEKIDKYYNSMKDYMKDDWNDFQEVEYIWRDGSTQAYIDTGWKPSWSVGFKEEIGLRFDTSGQRHCFLASRGNSSTYPFSLEVNSGDVTNNRVRFYSENSASSNGAIQFYSSNIISTGVFHDVSITSSGTAVVDGVTTTGSLYSGSNNASDTQLLFIDREFRWSTFNRNHYVSYLKIYENNVLVRDFVPCYRISDNVIGMFDKVSSIFYTNSGSGTFSKGPRVIRERDITFCDYIQSTGTQYIKTNIVPSNTKGIYMRLSSQDITTDLLYIGSRKSSDTRFWIGNSTNSSGNLYLGWNTNDRGIISTNTVFEVKLNYLNDRKKQVNDTVVASNIGALSSSNDVPIYIFAGNDNYSTDPSLYAPSKIKLHSCKISDGSNIIADFKPCYIKKTGEAGLWDEVEQKFYGNDGTGAFYRGNNGDVSSLYQKVEYIQSSSSGSGTSSTGQYINTGYNPNNKTKVEFKVGNWTNTGTSSNDLFSSDETFSVNGFGLLAGYYNFYAGATFTHNFNDTNIHIGEFSQQGLYKDGQLLVTPATHTFQSNTPLCLFALNRNGTISEHSTARLYYFKIYNDGVLVRDFIPCYRKTDNVIGLYDLVTESFYTNAGSGSFTKGANV